MLISVLLFQDSQDLLTGSLFNYSIYKYKHYRWQKRILQVMQIIHTSGEISPKDAIHLVLLHQGLCRWELERVHRLQCSHPLNFIPVEDAKHRVKDLILK